MSVESENFEGSAPGRMDVMGGIADYSGSLVLQMPIRETTTVRLRLRNDFLCNLYSELSDGTRLQDVIDYRSLITDQKVNYDLAKATLHKSPEKLWVAYVIGCALVLQKEKEINFKGADFHVYSGVPLGKGVSSSASLEVATMKALAKAFDLSFDNTELSRLAQKVENFIVGAACGLMDQLATYFGVPGKLLPILCQPDKLQPLIDIPKDLYFIGIDSGIRHSVGGSSYTDVRCAAFMGYSIIAKSFGVTIQQIQNAKVAQNSTSLPYRGYLCNISVLEFQEKFSSHLPETMYGGDFLESYGDTIDNITMVVPGKIYRIYDATAHPVFENERVKHFVDCLIHINNSGDIEQYLKKMGSLMYEAHESYSRCGLGSQRTDEIVSLAKNKFKNNIYGAKITGGGGGGTVCILGKREAGRNSAKDIHAFMQDKYNEELVLFESAK